MILSFTTFQYNELIPIILWRWTIFKKINMTKNYHYELMNLNVFDGFKLLSLLKPKVSYLWPVWPLQVGSWVFLTGPYWFLLISLLSGILRYSRLHLINFLIQTWSQPTLQEALIHFSEKLYFKIIIKALVMALCY